MKLNKILAVAVLGLFASSAAFGQLMVRESMDARLIHGTRPEAGNFGFTIGSGFAEIVEMIDDIGEDKMTLRGLPLMNFNYYLNDNIEITLGTQVYNKKMVSSGNLMDDSDLGIEAENTSLKYLRFMPGVNYHFDQTNFFDTYGGVNIILGTQGEKIQVAERINETGDYYAETQAQSAFVWGYDVHFGIRRFIADLPLAISFEAGIQGVSKSGTEYEFETESTIGGVKTSQTYYTKDADDDLRFKDLDQSEFVMGGNLRFGITYFFRN
jgi:hypothetical protein